MSHQRGRARERLWTPEVCAAEAAQTSGQAWLSEKRSRKATVFGLGAMLAASFVGGAATHLLMSDAVEAQGAGAVVTATQVNLVDGAGRLRGVLAGSDPGGLASITLYDQAGQARSTMAVEPDGTPLIQLHGPGGETRLRASVEGTDPVILVGDDARAHGLFATVGGAPRLTFGDGNRNRLQLYLADGGLPRVSLVDGAGREAASLAVGGDDMPQLALAAGGRPRAVLTTVGNATVLNLGGSAGTRLVAGVAEDGAPSIIFLDGQGAFMASLGDVGNRRLGLVNSAGEVTDLTSR